MNRRGRGEEHGRGARLPSAAREHPVRVLHAHLDPVRAQPLQTVLDQPPAHGRHPVHALRVHDDGAVPHDYAERRYGKLDPQALKEARD